jgi:hypothetical protein
MLSSGERLHMLSSGERLHMLSSGERLHMLSSGERLHMLSSGVESESEDITSTHYQVLECQSPGTGTGTMNEDCWNDIPSINVF